MSGIVVTNRVNLLRTFSDMRFSQSAKHKAMLLFGSIKTQSEKEEAARRAIPLVKACKTEKEAVEAVAGIVKTIAIHGIPQENK